MWVLCKASHHLFLLQLLSHPVTFMQGVLTLKDPKHIPSLCSGLAGCCLLWASKRLMAEHHWYGKGTSCRVPDPRSHRNQCHRKVPEMGLRVLSASSSSAEAGYVPSWRVS